MNSLSASVTFRTYFFSSPRHARYSAGSGGPPGDACRTPQIWSTSASRISSKGVPASDRLGDRLEIGQLLQAGQALSADSHAASSGNDPGDRPTVRRLRRPASADPLLLTSPHTAHDPREDRHDRVALHDQADVGVWCGDRGTARRARRDICPAPWRRAPGRVGGELSEASGGLRGRNVAHPLLIALDCVAADSGLLRLVRLHGGKVQQQVRRNKNYI